MVLSLLITILVIMLVYGLVRWWTKNRAEGDVWRSMIRLKAPLATWPSKAFSQTVNLKILQAFNEEGIKFAFPTTTTYLSQEDGQTLFFSGAVEE